MTHVIDSSFGSALAGEKHCGTGSMSAETGIQTVLFQLIITCCT